MYKRNLALFLSVIDEYEEQRPNHTVATPLDGTWQNLTVTRENGIVTVYVDNEAIASTYLTEKHLELDSDNQIGQSHFSTASSVGEVRSLSFYTYALSELERSDLFEGDDMAGGNQAICDVVSAFPLIENDVAMGTANRAAFQAANDSGLNKLWVLRGGSGNLKPYYISSTIILTSCGRNIWGTGGIHEWESGIDDLSAILLMDADAYSTTFNGTTKTGSATNVANSVVTLVGRAVVPEDLYGSFMPTGGTHFTTNKWFGIKSVDIAANTWTLTGNCTDGAAASGMTGYYCPELVQNRGSGYSHIALNFEAQLNNTKTKKGGVGYHIVVGTQATGSGDINTGQHDFYLCTWTNFEYAVLIGGNMDKYGEKAIAWDHSQDDHADNVSFKKCVWYFCTDAIIIRNYQSVNFIDDGCRAFLNGSFYRCEAGGNIISRGLELSGTVGIQRVLTLGGGISNNNGTYRFSGIKFDIARNPQLIYTEFDNITSNICQTVVFDGVVMRREVANDGLHVVDIQSCITLKLTNIQGCALNGGLWLNSIRMRKGPIDGLGRKPAIIIENCFLDVVTQHTVIDTAASDSGLTVVFRNNHDGRGTFFADEVYTTP